MRKSHFVPLLLAVVVGAAAPRPANAAVISINFDVDANGNPINAQPGFARYTAALTTLYSPLGVTFSGPAPNSGGAKILISGLTH